jgi:hypothetical protein
MYRDPLAHQLIYNPISCRLKFCESALSNNHYEMPLQLYELRITYLSKESTPKYCLYLSKGPEPTTYLTIVSVQ